MRSKNLGSGYKKIVLNKREKSIYYRVTQEIHDNISSSIHSPSLVEEILISERKRKKAPKK